MAPATDAASSMRPPGGVARTALSMRLSRMRRTAVGSARMRSGAPARGGRTRRAMPWRCATGVHAAAAACRAARASTMTGGAVIWRSLR